VTVPNGGSLSNLGQQHPRLDKEKRMKKQIRTFIVKWSNNAVYKYFVNPRANSSIFVKKDGWMP